MANLPILFNGDFKQVVGSVELSDELLDVYTKSRHLVINPVIRTPMVGMSPEVVAFSIYPMPPEPEKKRKKREKNS